MEHPKQYPAWIETADGKQVPLTGHCTIGRASTNDLVLDNEKVSRRHAMVHRQGEQEYWLVDFGSANGTSVNGRRVLHPTQLHDRDELEIAGIRFRFYQPQGKPAPKEGKPTAQATIVDIKLAQCWLLLADIVSSTHLTQSHDSTQFLVIIGKWFFDCKRVIDDNGGVINKFLGDGFFAYWEGGPGSAPKVLAALKELIGTQKLYHPKFRLVLHYGAVSLGGSGPLGEESLVGKEVHFAFRMEKLAGALGLDCLLSHPAKENLPEISATPAGRHSLTGFEGEFPFYQLEI